jgi:hypothetical protein
MGERFTARLSEENAEWIETEAQERDRSKAWVLDELVSAIRGAESAFSHRTDAEHTDAHRTADDGTDLEDVLDRLADLEQRVDNLEGADESAASEEFDKAADGLSDTDDGPSASKQTAESGESASKQTVASAQSPGFEADVDGRVREAVERVSTSWTDSDERLATRRDAAAVVLQHALDTGEPVGKSSDVVDDVQAAFPVQGQKPETYWRKNIRPVLKEFGEYNQGAHGYVVDGLDS